MWVRRRRVFRMGFVFRMCCVLASAALGGASAHAAPPSVVVASGEVLPGTPAGAVVASVSGLWKRSFTDAGDVVLAVSLAIGPGGVHEYSNNLILRVGADGAREVLAREGDPAPGTPGAFLQLARPLLADGGRVVFDGALAPVAPVTASDNGTSHLQEGAGAPVTLFTREGDLAPGLPYPLSVSPSLEMNAAGEVAIRHAVQTSVSPLRTPVAIFAPDGAGGLTPIALGGEPAPGMSGFTLGEPNELNLTDSGHVTFRASVSDGVPPSDGFRIFRRDPSGVISVLQLNGSNHVTNDLGDVATVAALLGGGIVIEQADGSLANAVPYGAPLPGSPAFSLAAVGGRLVMNEGRQVAAPASIEGPPGSVSLGAVGPLPGGIGVLAAVGAQVPGMATGVTFAGLGTEPFARWLDESGGTVLMAQIQGPGVTPGNDQILLYTAPDGGQRIVARSGEMVGPVAGQAKQIAALGSPPDPFLGQTFWTPSSYALNENRELLFLARFTDGTSALLRADLKPECANGRDDDADGAIDAPADPGCRDATLASRERTLCQNGLDDDGDGAVDFDGGASALGGTPIAASDPQCGDAWRNAESTRACGLGAELTFVLAWLARAARRAR